MVRCQVKGGLVCRQLNSKSSIKHFVFFKAVLGGGDSSVVRAPDS